MSLIVLINGVNDFVQSDIALNVHRREFFSTLFPDADVHNFDFFAEDINSLTGSYLSERARSIINSLQQSTVSPSNRREGEPAAVVFLAHTTGATIVKQILLLALAHPAYQWLAFGVVRLHFFDSQSFVDPQLWDRFLIQALGVWGIHRLGPSQLFSILPDALSKVEREFIPISQGFDAVLHNEPQPQNPRDTRSPFWTFDEDDPRVDEVVGNIRGDLRKRSIGQQTGFQLLHRDLSLRTISLSRLEPITIDPGSTTWLLANQNYKKWMGSANTTVLEIVGTPGSGSTYVCSHIISTVKPTDEDVQVFVLNFNIDRWDSRRNTAQSLLSSLIRQLLTLAPRLYRTVKNISDLLVLQSNITYEQLLSTLCSLLSKEELRLFLVINGADQCLQPLRSVISSLAKVPFKTGYLKLLVATSTSLELPEDVPHCQILLSDVNTGNSIRSSLEQRVTQIMVQKPEWEDYREDITQKLCGKGSTYLQAILNIKILESSYTPSTRKGIKEFLLKIPLQPNDTFEIAAGAFSQGEPTKLLLNWVFHSLRPLTISELAVALTLDPGKGVTLDMIHDEMSLTAVRELVSSMGTILRLVDDEVMPIHYTIRPYFEEKRLLEPNFHAFMMRCCLMYLSACSAHVTITPDGAGGSNQSCAKPATTTVFLDYAETFWLAHYRSEPTPTKALDDEVLQFLTSSTGWMRRFADIYQLRVDFDLEDTLLLASRLGLLCVVQEMAKNESTRNPSRNVAVLAASANSGSIEVFRYLLERITPDLDLMPVLCAAAEYGHSHIVQLLMDKIYASSSPEDNRQDIKEPLLLATSNGHASTIQILLSHGHHIVNTTEIAQDGETNALHLAAQRGDVETLLTLQRLRREEFDMLVERPNSDGRSPLQLCCISGSSQAFDILFHDSTSKKEKGHELYQLLTLAAEHGHLAIVDQLLLAGAPIVEEIVDTAEGPLLLAARNGHYTVVCRLINHGKALFNSAESLESTTRGGLWKLQLSSSFDVSFEDISNYDERIVALLAPHRDASKQTDEDAMERAIHNGQLDIVKVLRGAGIAIHLNNADLDYNYFMDYAINSDSPGIVRFLMDQGTTLAWDESWKMTALHYAALRKSPLCVRELLRKATLEYVWKRNGANKTAFEIGVEVGSAAVVRAFLAWRDGDTKFEPFQMLQRPAKLLLTAVRSNEMDLVRLLLDNGWSASNVESRSQDLPLHVAIEIGNQDIIKLLLEKSANPSIRNSKGETALHIAVQYNSETSIKTLLDQKAAATVSNLEGFSPLHLAIRENVSNLVAALLGFGDDWRNESPGEKQLKNKHLVNAEILQSGMTPLSMAIENRNSEIVHMLLKAGANPSGRGGALGTLLNTALYIGELDIIKALLSSGADTKATTKAFGGPFHALQYSEQGNEVEEPHILRIRAIASLLLTYKAEIDVVDDMGLTPLMRAIIHGNLQYASLLLELGALSDEKGSSLSAHIHYAASWGSGDLVKELIQARLDPCVSDAWSRKPLYLAALMVPAPYLTCDERDDELRFYSILEALPAQDVKSHLESALTAAVKGGSKRLFREIIQVEGLDPNIPDRHQWTALDIADCYPTLAEEAVTLRSMGAVNSSEIKEPTRLSLCDMSYDVSLSPDGREAWVEGTTHKTCFTFGGSVRADHCIPAHKQTYFEVEILELHPGNTIAVGFVEENVNLLPVIGWRDGSWGYHSDDGSIITENNIVIDGAPPYESGQTVGVAIDMVRRKACFVLDDTWTSSAFEIYGQLYPAVGFNWRDGGRSKVRINFGAEKGGSEFKYKPSDDWVEKVAPEILPEPTSVAD